MFSLVFKFIYAAAHIWAPCTVWKSMSVCCNQIFLLKDIQCVWVYAPVFQTKLLRSVMIKVLSQHPLTWHGMAWHVCAYKLCGRPNAPLALYELLHSSSDLLMTCTHLHYTYKHTHISNSCWNLTSEIPYLIWFSFA